MKLTCELCGGSLQVTSGGTGATCTTCGLNYPMSRLREMLGLAPVVKQEPVKEEPAVIEVPKEEPVKEEPVVIETPNEEPATAEPVVPVQKPQIKTVKVVKKATVKPSVKPAVEPVVEPVVNSDPEPVVQEEPAPVLEPAFIPQQFVMQLGPGVGDLSGYILQGSVGIGDKIYINGDYAHPYSVYNINDDANMLCAKAGSHVDLFLSSCPKRVLNSAHSATGIARPEANAYNYPGTVQEFFTDLLRREFVGFQIQQNVPINGVRLPATYLLSKNGKPAAAIYLVHSNDDSGRYFASKAAGICAEQGYGCTHFFENYRNDTSYVVGRIKGVLGF